MVAVRHTLGVRQTANPVRDSRTLHDVQTAVDGFNALDSRVTNVTIIYTDGDPCDIPAESRTVPRRIEVQYFCDDNIPTLRTATVGGARCGVGVGWQRENEEVCADCYFFGSRTDESGGESGVPLQHATRNTIAVHWDEHGE